MFDLMVEFSGHKIENPNIMIIRKLNPDSWVAGPRTPWYQLFICDEILTKPKSNLT